MNRFCYVDDSSRVAEARRAAQTLARQEELSEGSAANLSVIVTEVCTNLLKHAGRGEVYLSSLSDRGGVGVEVLAMDRGPGMKDVARCLADGYSSTQTAGTGLGAIMRMSQAFDIYSQPDKGTVVMAQVVERGDPVTRVGAVVKALDGEEFSGDAWACSARDGRLSVMVADGLGHGVMASKASAEATASFRSSQRTTPEMLLEEAHLALRGTRGAAVAVAVMNDLDGAVTFAGIGNIGAVISEFPKPQFMVSLPGTAGFGSPKIQSFAYQAREGSLMVMHSDGLATSWRIDDYPGLRQRHPAVIAGVLHRDARRGRDDSCVVVAKREAAA